MRYFLRVKVQPSTFALKNRRSSYEQAFNL